MLRLALRPAPGGRWIWAGQDRHHRFHYPTEVVRGVRKPSLEVHHIAHVVRVAFGEPKVLLQINAHCGKRRTVTGMTVDSRTGDRNRLLVHPTSAKVVLEVLRAPAGTRDITKTVMTDPALAASVLRAANSAHLGYSRRISSIRQAAVMLGGSLVGSLAASRVADLVFDTDAPDYPDWLWLHSLTVACACSVLARHTGESIDEAFTVGLLHEVGWLLAASNGVPMPSNDTDHTSSGAELLARWNLPDRIVASVQQHHTRTAALNAPLDRITVAAHGLVAAMGVPSPERSISPAEALVLVNMSDLRQTVLLGQIESELISLTNELTIAS